MSLTQIPDALERIFLNRGWYQVYARHITDLQFPNMANEMYCRCPWKDVNDNNASMSINAHTGLFQCFRTQRAGNYLQFRQWLDATNYGPDGMLVPLHYKAVEEIVMREEGLVPPTEEWIQNSHLNLIQSPETIAWIQQRKPWFIQAFQQLQIGYDFETGCIVIPIRNEQGKLINARLYNPNGQPKMRWLVPGLTGNFLFPYTGIQEDNLILVEGETKVITLRGLGFNAVSGTVSGTSPVPAGNWYRMRNITVLKDEDTEGERAASKSINIMRTFANEIKLALLPNFDGKQKGADICDYVTHLMKQNNSFESLVYETRNLLEQAEVVASQSTIYDVESIPVSFTNLLGSERYNQKLSFVAKVSARSEKRYMGVTRFDVNCPGRGHAYCFNCIMSQRYEGHGEFWLDRRAPDQLRMIATNDAGRIDAAKRIVGIPSQCPSCDMTPLEWVGYEPTEISASFNEHEENNEVTDAERHRREAYFIVNPETKIEENRDYAFTGFLYSDPRTQSGLVVIDTALPLSTTAERFVMSDFIAQRLKPLQPKNQNDAADVINMLNARATDLSDSVTGIKGRLDMHLAMSLVWHSAIAFHIGTQKVNRGWLELLILGDTRSGKSVAFRSLCQHYNVGTLVDCRNQTTAGLLGAVNTSSVSGERYITAGLLPQNDKGVVGLDEMEGERQGHVALLEQLASMRSEGIVRITKAAQAQYRARVRLVCMANPGKGLLIHETGKTGAELILQLIPQPENIARFDAALAVSQIEVTSEQINEKNGLTEPIFSQEAQRLLLMWVYSRKSDQINFTEGAQEYIKIASSAMCEKYDSSLPLVESSDQKNRIAKWAVAIAGYLFSSDETLENIVVTQAHVIAAHRLLEFFFDKYAMGYDRFSEVKRQQRILQNEKEIRETMDSLGSIKYKIAQQLLSNDEISDRAFRNIVSGPAATKILSNLIHNNCIKLMLNGRRDSYEKNPTFTQWLKLYVAEEKVKEVA